MQLIKKFVYIFLQIFLGFTVLGYAAIRYRQVDDFDLCYIRLSDWFTRVFID